MLSFSLISWLIYIFIWKTEEIDENGRVKHPNDSDSDSDASEGNISLDLASSHSSDEDDDDDDNLPSWDKQLTKNKIVGKFYWYYEMKTIKLLYWIDIEVSVPVC